MFVVAETTAAKQMVDLIGGEILEGVGPVQCVTWKHVRRRCGRVGGKKENTILANTSCLGHGIGRRGSRGSCGRGCGSRRRRDPLEKNRALD